MEVAVKTLKKGSDEDDKVKFLQEAAIMSQFRHPNVVTTYGVVTDEEPVSCIHIHQTLVNLVFLFSVLAGYGDVEERRFEELPAVYED